MPGRDSYGTPNEELHDDLAMALCCALWWGERTGRPFGAKPKRVMEGL